MIFILPLIFFLLANATTVFVIKKEFGKCLPITAMLCAIILYISQIVFKTFVVGYVLNYIYAFISIIFFIIYLKKKDIKSFFKYYNTRGLYVFLALYLVVFIFDFRRYFTNWDEWSHWGVMLKEMIRLDKFYTDSMSTLMYHKDYPPIVQLFELFYINISGVVFKESSAITALHLLQLVFIVPFVERKKNDNKKSVIEGILIFFVLMLTILFFDQHPIIDSIYTDYFLGIIVASIVSTIFVEKEYNTIYFYVYSALVFSTLLLTKQMGIPLYMMCVFLLVLFVILRNNKEKKYKYIILGITVILIPALFWLSWNVYKNSFDIVVQFNISDIKLSQLYGIARYKSGEPYQQQSISNFINQVETRSISTSYISMTYVQAIMLGLLILTLVLKKYKVEKNNKVILIITLVIGAIGYLFTLMNLYLFCFEPREAISLASFERYTATYVLIVYVVSIMLFIYKNNKISYLYFIAVLLFIIQSNSVLYRIYPSFIQKHEVSSYEIAAEKLYDYVKDKGNLYIMPGPGWEQSYFIHYYLEGIKCNNDLFVWDNNEKLDYKENYEKNIKDTLYNYDYLFVTNYDDEYLSNYNFLFKGQAKYGDLYKVIKDKNDNLILERITNIYN